MKGMTKMAAVFAVIALVAAGLAAAVYPAGAADTLANTNTNALGENSEIPAGSCGVSCAYKASCGCGCGR